MKKFLSMMCLVMLSLTMSSCSTVTKAERDVAQVGEKTATEYTWSEREKFYHGEK